MSENVVDYDSPWKEALEHYFPAFVRLFFPEIYDDIDWLRGHQFLDKELQRVVRDAKLGRRLADKLVKVWRKNGAEAWVLIHVEVQGEVETEFQERMYVYNYRFYDRYHRAVVSIAILADTDIKWRPDRHEYALWGCEVGFRFPMVKLLDYREPERWQALDQSANPFAVIVMAHLEALATRHASEERYHAKLRLVRGLYRKGFTKKDVLEVFRVIDWMLTLPEELETAFEREVTEYEEEHKMAYVTSIERRASERGLQRGLQQGSLRTKQEDVLDILEARFVTVPETIATRIKHTSDLDSLKALLRKAGTATSLEEFQGNLP